MKTSIVVTFICLILLTPSIIKADSTVIYNSVSVSANSGNGGKSSASIKTIHNGEVVENFYISTTTDFTYQSGHMINESDKDSLVKHIEIKNNTSSLSVENHVQQLTSLLNNLLTLLDHYEKLLDKQ